jgi:ubiquinone/menaquinone biosynthesis C-methylase UbiE
VFRRRAPATAPAPPDWRSYDGVAETYDRVRAPIHEGPARDLVEAVGIRPGDRVLDVGTGTGVAAAASGEAAGPDGLVVGVDPSIEMLRLARGRGVRVAAAEAIDLPFPDASFDAVTGAFVIFFFRNYETALFDMLRVLRPAGRLGVTTWGPGEDEFRRAWREMAERYAGREVLRGALAKAAPWEEQFSERGRLATALREAGLRDVTVDQRRYRAILSIEDYLAGREISATGRFLRSILGDMLWPRFQSEVRELFRSRFPDPLGDTETALVAAGTKPS